MILYGAAGLLHRRQAYLLLLQGIRLHWGVEQLPALARGKRGKPYFPDFPDYHFNLSHSGSLALDPAGDAIRRGKSGPIPRQLQNKHFAGEDAAVKGQNYLYPHSYPNRWVAQQYLPDALVGTKYYEFADNKNEQAARAYWERIKNGGGK